jgi:glucosamine-6-phosphate deaminase
MNITIAKNEAEFDRMAAWRIIGEMIRNSHAVIGLSTGQTTKNMHAVVAHVFRLYPFDVEHITVFNVDELTHLPREYKGSCYTLIKEQFVDPLGIKEENFIMPPTLSDDFVRESALFRKALADRGGIDLQVLGLGANGHIGINQPGTPFESLAWVSPMDPDFEKRVREETHIPPEHPLGGLTLGIKDIMHARKIVSVAKGRHKAGIVKKMLEGPVTTDVPASVLQLHPN